jgi:hypothetical protein
MTFLLADSPSNTSDYLNWIYDSFHGNRPKQNAVFDMFIDKFFPEHKKDYITTNNTENFRKTMQDIKGHILQCRKLVKGEWLYPEQQPINKWLG